MSFNDEYMKLRRKRLSGDIRSFNNDANIAPVVSNKDEEEEKKSTWFNKGTLEDGYQFGDILGGALTTTTDLVLGASQGALGLVEGLSDLLLHGVAGVSDLVGGDAYADRVRKIANQNDVEKVFQGARSIGVDEYSFLGDKGYGVAQGLGQVGAIIATGGLASSAAGATALTTGVMGASSMGSGMSEAYQSGATDKEALSYGVMKGVVDAGSELLFGGLGKTVNALGLSRGLTSLDDAFAKKLSSKISSQFWSNAVEFGVKASAEGAEEVIAGLGSAAAKKLTYMSDEELNKLIEDEDLLDQFIMGAVTSGIAQSGIVPGMNNGSLREANATGRDFITGLSANEQTVVDKVYEDMVAEAEKGGQELTNKQKNKIYDEVVETLKKGGISTDTIESVLGGDTYKSYKETVDGEDAIMQEFEELGKKQNATLADQARYAELQAKVKDIKDNSPRSKLQAQLSEEVQKKLSRQNGKNIQTDDYLMESYNERARRGIAYEADLSQYDEKQAKVIDNAIKSGILNNTRRTHEFVDMIAKISADKGVSFDFTNNEKLKESGFAVDGKTVNGFVTKDGITLNVQSAKSLNSVVGHEVAHVLEGTELYAELQNAVFEYAKSKNDYDGRYADLESLYKDVEGADINAELTADLIGDYLFTDEAFIKNLSTKNRNVFQKMYDEVKYLYKIATAGSKEARELEKVKRAFDKAYKESGSASGDTKYSISDSDGKKLTKEQSEYFKDSKMRDDNGNLKVMYHGSQDAGFHEFNAEFSDDDTSFFFVDRNDVAASYSGTTETYEAQTIRTAEDMNNFIESIGVEGYEVVEKDGKYTLLYEGDRVADSKTAQGIYDEFCWYEGVGEGDANYKVYLNLTNPLEIDAKGRPWNKIDAEFSQEVYDKYNSLTDEEKAALTDLAEWEDFRIFNSEIQEARDNDLASAYEKMGEDCNIYDLFSVAADRFSEEAMRENARKYLKTRDYAQRAKEQGYDGVIFKNIIDNGGYSNGSEGASTVAIAFESNQIKSVANEKPTGDPDIRYSLTDGDDTYSRIYDLRVEVNNLRQSIREFEATDDFKAQHDKLSEAIRNDDIVNGVKAYQQWQETSGYAALLKKRDDLQVELDNLQKEFDSFATNKAINEEKAAIEKSGLSEADYFRKQAVKEFGYTPYFYDAGYIVPNGKMLNFSGEKGYHYGGRGQDHRAIGTIYADTTGSDALNRFVKDGNIRIMAESPGIDISAAVEPTKEQYATIRKFVYEYADKEYFNVDITDENGRVVGSLQYENRINPTRILNDIKHYYSTGEIRQQSDVDRFRYSLSKDSDGNDLSHAVQMRFANSKVVDESGSLKVVYHGTASGEFSIFDKSKGNVEGDYGSGFYFTDNRADVADHYEGGGPDFEIKVGRRADEIYGEEEGITYEEAERRAHEELYKGSHLFETYLNIENPAIVGETILFSPESYYGEYNREDYDNEDDYYGDVEQLIVDDIDGIIWDIDRNVDVNTTDGIADVLWGAFNEDGIDLETLKKRINNLYLEDSNGALVGNEVTRQIIESLGYDGIIDPTVSGKWNMNMEEGTTHYIVFKPNQIKAVTNQNPTDNPDIHRSLSREGEQIAPIGRYNVYGKDIALETAPVAETAPDNGTTSSEMENVAPMQDTAASTDNTPDLERQYKVVFDQYRNALKKGDTKATERLGARLDELNQRLSRAEAEEMFGQTDSLASEPEDFAPISDDYSASVQAEIASLTAEKQSLESRLMEATEKKDGEAVNSLLTEYDAVLARLNELQAEDRAQFDSLGDADAPEETDTDYYEISDNTRVGDHTVKKVSKALAEVLALDKKSAATVGDVVQRYSTGEIQSEAELFDEIKEKFGENVAEYVDEQTAEVKRALRGYKLFVSDTIKGDITEYNELRKSLFGKLFTKKRENGGIPVDTAYMELSERYPGYFPEDIINPTEQFLLMADLAQYDVKSYESYMIDDEDIQQAVDIITFEVGKAKEADLLRALEADSRAFMDEIAPTLTVKKEQVEGQRTMFEEAAVETKKEKPIKTVKDRLTHKLHSAYGELSHNKRLRREALEGFNNKIDALRLEYDSKKNHDTKVANNLLRSIERYKRLRDDVDADYTKRINDLREKVEKRKAKIEEGYDETEGRAMRADVHAAKLDEIKNKFAENGLDLDETLRNAKNLSTFATVDNTPQRVMEKSLGYKEGQILADATVNKVAQNETEGIKWLNTITSRKGDGGLLKQLSEQYDIKPGSKESAAAQMYAEGFYVNDNGDYITYGDAELAKDFPDAQTQKNIKGLAGDPRIRQFYDETLAKINESRTRNAYPEIKPLDNYYLHFRAMDDTFSRLGIPFNPNDIRAKDLPTDLNGVTADLKPGQPYFASAMHRRGQKTSHDLLGGIERYANGAKNQIYHIDDIQTLRALRNYIAETYGQANGLEGLDALDEDAAQEKIKQVYNSHLSTFAKFLNEEANVIAGKTALIDRGLEGIIGRRGMTFLDTVNKQVGANMVGMNVSSSLTNFIAGVQAIAKTNKLACVKAFAQTASSKIGSIFGKTDSFAENNPTMIRRKGADRFYRTPFQKVGDAGYVLMSAVDNVTTEFIVRAKYNEYIKNGMTEEQAIAEADKWTSRLMADRSLGQMPQIYNSKTLGVITKFQLEVRNQLDSQFYDTIKETKASNEHIEDNLKRNAKTAAKVTATFVELAVLQHLFGKAFESVAGYNPTFDIIDVLVKALGFDDDEDSEDTALDNVEQGFLALLEDLPYTSTFTGGRIPISSALPVKELITGKDDYGSDKSRLETLGEIAPYYVLPTGYGQIKKTVQGLSMFDEDLPVSGSYTDSGNLRFPVEDTFGNRVQAGLFGQWASENARDYFDNDYAPLNKKQIQEYIDVDLPIKEYREYREGLSGLKTLDEKADYIASLDLPISKKNLLVNNLTDREDEIDLSEYDKYGNFDEMDFAHDHEDVYEFLKENNITYKQYVSLDKDTKEAYTWAAKNPEKYTLSKAIASDVVTYRRYTSELYDIKADKDSEGKSISGSRKEKVIEYINNLDADYGERIILFKSQYKADDTYNYDIVEYLNSRDDISYEEMVAILKELGFTVSANGDVTW